MFRARKKRNPKALIVEALTAVSRAKNELARARWRLENSPRSLPEEERRRLLETIEFYNILLDKISLRLNTFLAINIITKEMIGPYLKIIREIQSNLSGLSPMLSTTLIELESMFAVLFEEAPAEEPVHLAESGEETLSKTAKKILEEARKEAKRRTGTLLGTS